MTAPSPVWVYFAEPQRGNMPSHHVGSCDVLAPEEGSKPSRLRRLSIHHATAGMDVRTPLASKCLSKGKIITSTYLSHIAMDIIHQPPHPQPRSAAKQHCWHGRPHRRPPHSTAYIIGIAVDVFRHPPAPSPLKQKQKRWTKLGFCSHAGHALKPTHRLPSSPESTRIPSQKKGN